MVFGSVTIALIVALPIITVFYSFLETSDYLILLKNTFLLEYINNSFVILFSVLIITFIVGVSSFCIFL